MLGIRYWVLGEVRPVPNTQHPIPNTQHFIKMENLKHKESILVISTGFVVLFLIFSLQWMLWIAAGVSILGLMSSTIAYWIHTGWMKLALALGWINSKILLSIVFFVFLMPVAFLQRLVLGDKLQLKKKKEDEGGYYVERNYTYEKKDLENVW